MSKANCAQITLKNFLIQLLTKKRNFRLFFSFSKIFKILKQSQNENFVWHVCNHRQPIQSLDVVEAERFSNFFRKNCKFLSFKKSCKYFKMVKNDTAQSDFWPKRKSLFLVWTFLVQPLETFYGKKLQNFWKNILKYVPNNSSWPVESFDINILYENYKWKHCKKNF